MIFRRVALVLLSVASLGFATNTGHAQRSLEQRQMEVTFEAGRPQISVSAADIVDAHVRRELNGGLRRTIATRVYAYRERGGSAVAATVVSCDVTFDLFEERYRVRRATPDADRTVWVSDFAGVVTECLRYERLPVGTASAFRNESGERMFFAVEVEFNPVSQGTVERIRRLLARGGGYTDASVFGSFVSMFVNRSIGSADRVLAFRSQVVVVP